MKICIVSDSHHRAPLPAAATAAEREEGAEAILHCGDLLGDLALLRFEIRASA